MCHMWSQSQVALLWCVSQQRLGSFPVIFELCSNNEDRHLWSSWLHRTQRQSLCTSEMAKWELHQWGPRCSWSIQKKSLLWWSDQDLSSRSKSHTHTQLSFFTASHQESIKFLWGLENMLNSEEARNSWPGKEKRSGRAMRAIFK